MLSELKDILIKIPPEGKENDDLYLLSSVLLKRLENKEAESDLGGLMDALSYMPEAEIFSFGKEDKVFEIVKKYISEFNSLIDKIKQEIETLYESEN